MSFELAMQEQDDQKCLNLVEVELQKWCWDDVLARECQMINDGQPSNDDDAIAIVKNCRRQDGDIVVDIDVEWIEQQHTGCHDKPLLHKRDTTFQLTIFGEQGNHTLQIVDDRGSKDPKEDFFPMDYQ